MKDSCIVVCGWGFLVALALLLDVGCLIGVIQHSRLPLYQRTSGVITVSEKGWRNSVTIQYRFVVNGKDFEGKDLSVFAPKKIDDLDKYPLGQEVIVYYDPAAPHRCVLSRNTEPFYYLVLFVGLPGINVFLLLVVYCVVLEWQMARKRQAGQLIGMMTYSEEGAIKSLRLMPINSFLIGGFVWFSASLAAGLTGANLESATLNIVLGIGSFLLGFLAFLYWSIYRSSPSIEWIVDSFQKTLTLDSRSMKWRQLIPFDRLEGFYLTQSRSRFGKFCEKWIDRRISWLNNELWVRFRDDQEILLSVKLASLRKHWGTFEEHKIWLERECLIINSSPEHRS